MNRDILVYENWSGNRPQLLGHLHVSALRNKEGYAFTFDEGYLRTNQQLVLDPHLVPFMGRQYSPDGALFGLFADASPDRWGRMLMQRHEHLRAKAEGRQPRTLLASDFLLNVCDEARLGGLRFALKPDGGFLAASAKGLDVPPLAGLRELEMAVEAFETASPDSEQLWLKTLLRPGSSLGGARPKAVVRDPGGGLWIAKFPSNNDRYDVGAWEMVAHDLAVMCGLDVPPARLMRGLRGKGVFLSKRFDRNGKRRVHFASAMTMLGRRDGDSGASYLDMVEFIRRADMMPRRHLRELWRRLAFALLVSNADNHLRNHGFLLVNGRSWELSPMYDVNPVPDATDLALGATESDTAISPETALAIAEFCGLALAEAKEEWQRMAAAVGGNWEKIARQCGIARRERERFSGAFRLGEKE